MKKNLLLILLVLKSFNIFSQEIDVYTLDTRTSPFIEYRPISNARYEQLRVFNSGRLYTRLVGIPNGAKVDRLASWYDISKDGSDWIVSAPVNKFIKRYRKGEELMVIGVDSPTLFGTVKYLQEGGSTSLPLTMNSFGNTIVELDICPDAVNPITIWSNGKARKWLYMKNKESVVFRVKNINSNSYTIDVNGAIHNLLIEGDDSAIANLFKEDKQNTGGAVGDNDSDRVDNIEASKTILDQRGVDLAFFNNLLKRWEGKACFDDQHTIVHWENEIRSQIGAVSIVQWKQDVKDQLKVFEENLNGISHNDTKSTYKKELDALKMKFSDSVLDELVDKLEEVTRSLLNRTVASLPITVNGQNADVVRFSVDKNNLRPISETSATYDIFIVGGVKIDVSAGLFINGLVDHSFIGKDSIFTTKVNDEEISTTKYTPIKQQVDKVSFSVGSLVHLYPRLNILQGNVNFGISAGASIGERVNYYGGLSTLVGRQQRFVLSYGLALGKVNRLSTLYEAEGSSSTPKYYNVTGGEFSLKSSLETSWFFSFTYNLSSNKVKESNE